MSIIQTCLNKFNDPYSIAQSKDKDDKKEFECPENGGNGNFADPATCRRFYQCVDGYPYMNRCPAGNFFMPFIYF